jgi:sortase A
MYTKALMVTAIAFAVIGVIQIGQGAYIYGKAAVASYLIDDAWDQTLTGARNVKPWPWADTWPVAKLSFPRLGEEVIALSGDSGRTLAFGPGTTIGAALPGEEGTSIIAGHRDTHFTFLQYMRKGDRYLVTRPDGVKIAYVITDTYVADARESVIEVTDEENRMVLVTCWPFDPLAPAGGPLRFVVEAAMTPLIEQQQSHNAPYQQQEKPITAMAG